MTTFIYRSSRSPIKRALLIWFAPELAFLSIVVVTTAGAVLFGLAGLLVRE